MTATANVRRYMRLHNEGSQHSIEAHDDHTVFKLAQLDPRPEDIRQMVEFHVANSMVIFNQIVQDTLPLLAVEFEHRQQGEIENYRELFGVTPKFNSYRTAMILPTAYLQATKIPTPDHRLFRLLSKQADQMLAQKPAKDDLVGQVRRYILQAIPDGFPSLEAVARELAMSSRTMSRRLAEKGVSFRTIADDVRRHLALKYLSENTLKIYEIAFLLGYAEISAFNHAFKRWTGVRPSEYRI